MSSGRPSGMVNVQLYCKALPSGVSFAFLEVRSNWHPPLDGDWSVAFMRGTSAGASRRRVVWRVWWRNARPLPSLKEKSNWASGMTSTMPHRSLKVTAARLLAHSSTSSNCGANTSVPLYAMPFFPSRSTILRREVGSLKAEVRGKVCVSFPCLMDWRMSCSFSPIKMSPFWPLPFSVTGLSTSGLM